MKNKKRFMGAAVFGITGAAACIAGCCAQKRKRGKTESRKQHEPCGLYEMFFKRPLDVLLGGTALVLLSPVIGITALLAGVKLGRPVFFTQERIGRDEKSFTLIKIRSMTESKDENGRLLPDVYRLTDFGKWLRSTSLDELPELINIIKGDMSIVGPRPLLPAYLPYYTKREHRRHDVRPGLTGYAQVHGRNLAGWEERFEMDVRYAAHITFLGDLKILFQTVKTVFRRDGITPAESDAMESFIDYAEKRKQRITAGMEKVF